MTTRRSASRPPDRPAGPASTRESPAYPSAEDYIRAVQRPDVVFDRPDLAAATFDTHPMLGIPVPASGSTAVVFRATVGGTPQALRFFTRDDASTQQRYTALNTWFTERGLTGDVAACQWVERAILVNGQRWPMVQMEWVAGRPLDQHVEDLVDDDDRDALATLAGAWRDLLRRAQAARFAHGDLQHGNVLVDDTGRPRLVDFDSSWIAPFEGLPPPSEGGHRNYQPENRVWGPWMDTFPGLVIYLSLLALAREPTQWDQLNDGENLLFGRRDYQPPHQTQAWTRVDRLHDPEIDRLAARLRACCAPDWTASTDLEALLQAPLPWWTRTTATTATSATSAASAASTPPVPPAPAPARPSRLDQTGGANASPWPDVPTTVGASPAPPQPGATWWQQTGGSTPPLSPPARTQAAPAGTPTASPPAPPAGGSPSATRAGRGNRGRSAGAAGPGPAAGRGRSAGRALRALGRALPVAVVAMAVWAVLVGALSPALGLAGAAAFALVPVLLVLFLFAIRARRRRGPPGGT